MAPSKRQTTYAKMMREQAVRDRRARKQEKKAEKKEAAAALRAGIEAPEEGAADDGQPESAAFRLRSGPA